MRGYLLRLVLIMMMSVSVSSVCHAITVVVESPSVGVYAVGFTVNGVQYGGPGVTFRQENLPTNTEYTFGLRIGGLVFGAEDIACTTLTGGYATVNLHSDTLATLMYDGNKKCYVTTYPINGV